MSDLPFFLSFVQDSWRFARVKIGDTAPLTIYSYNIMIAGIPFVLAPHYIHFL
jgi:hypothetical protein